MSNSKHSSSEKLILVTGGRGYLGGRICQYLVGVGGLKLRVSGRDNTPLVELPGVPIIRARLDNMTELLQACKGVDSIIHLAAMNAQACAASPSAAAQVNERGTENLIEAAREAKVRRLIYFSTAHVYGSNLKGEVTETNIPAPRSIYAESHLAAERLVLGADAIEGIVLRVSNVVGAPLTSNAQCWKLLVNELCREAVQKRSLTMRSDGKERRNFVCMADVLRVAEHFLELPREALTSNRTYNVGGASNLAVVEVVDLIESRCLQVLGYRPKRGDYCNSGDGPDRREDFIYRFQSLIESGFRLEGTLEEEIDNVLRFCLSSFA